MKHNVDEYVDDEDPGFVLYEVSEREFSRVSKQLADKYGFPERAINHGKKSKFQLKYLLIFHIKILK